MEIRLPDGSVLMHADHAPYDAAKAHEYYMRTRKLKGRRHGAGTFTVKTASGGTVKLSAKQLEEQKAYAAHRVAKLKTDLKDLSVILRDKLQKAKEAKTKAAKPPTLAEKAAAAREAQKYRKSHKQELANKAKTKAKSSSSGGSSSKSSTSKADTVASVRAEIVTTRANLKSAVARQRALASAKKNG